jgi:hypothetical protein
VGASGQGEEGNGGKDEEFHSFDYSEGERDTASACGARTLRNAAKRHMSSCGFAVQNINVGKCWRTRYDCKWDKRASRRACALVACAVRWSRECSRRG